MPKSKLNITMKQDLIESAKEHEPTKIIMSDPDFEENLLQTISRIKSGVVKWHTYQEVFDGAGASF
jgi:hypothetical protein